MSKSNYSALYKERLSLHSAQAECRNFVTPVSVAESLIQWISFLRFSETYVGF